MKIDKEHYLKIQSLAESGDYTYQEISNAFDHIYTLNQIKYYINKHCPNKNIKKEYSRGGTKLLSLLQQIFHYDLINKEYPLPNKLRVDFVISSPYNLAFEFDGSQHNNYSPHFHGDKSSFNQSKNRDSLKEIYLKERGINLIRLNSLDIDVSTLKALIDDTGVGTGIYIDNCTLTRQEKLQQYKQLNQQKAKVKSHTYVNPRAEEFKLKQKQMRQEQYQKSKEWKKKNKKL